jgi:hypothetical protein
LYESLSIHVEPLGSSEALGSSEQGAARRRPPRNGARAPHRLSFPHDRPRRHGEAEPCRPPCRASAWWRAVRRARRRTGQSGKALTPVWRHRRKLPRVRGRTGAAASMDHHALGVVRGQTDEVRSLAFFRPDAISSSTPEAQNFCPSANLSGI